MALRLAALALAAAQVAPTPTPAEEFERIKHALPGLSFEEAQALFAEAEPAPAKGFPQEKIEHMVVLFVENRAADHIFGCMLGDHPEFDGIPTRADGAQWKLMPTAPGSGADCGAGESCVNVSCGTAEWVCKTGAANLTTRMFNASQLPVKHAISQNFAIMNKMFTSVPGPSWPNHNFAQSATSCGTSSNVMYNACGGKTTQFPQMTIYDSLKLANVPFAIFVNDVSTAAPSAPCSAGSEDAACTDMRPADQHVVRRRLPRLGHQQQGHPGRRARPVSGWAVDASPLSAQMGWPPLAHER